VGRRSAAAPIRATRDLCHGACATDDKCRTAEVGTKPL